MGCEDFNSRCGVPQQGFRNDPVEQAAHNIARELYSPDPRFQQQAMNHIRQEVSYMGPREAERFTRILDNDMNGRSPLKEVPQMVRDGYGRLCPTGNDLLVLHDPFDGRREPQVLKQIRNHDGRRDQARWDDRNYNDGRWNDRQVWDERPPVIIQPRPQIYQPLPEYGPPVYRGNGGVGERIIDRAVDGFGLGVGLNLADKLFHNRHR